LIYLISPMFNGMLLKPLSISLRIASRTVTLGSPVVIHGIEYHDTIYPPRTYLQTHRLFPLRIC
jgi:hypothetical protein